MTDTRIGVDVGGTFTDVALLVDDDLITTKVPTTNDQHVGVIKGIHAACDSADIDPTAIDAFAHAMTVSVNALLERAGAQTALVTTAGFRDVLEIGRQARPSLYDLDAEKPAPLVPRRRRFEIDERATPTGIDESVDEAAIRDVAAKIQASGAESVAVCLLHAYAHPANERVVAEGLRDELDVPVSASHEVLAEFREFERTATTVAEAYVTPVIEGYLGRLSIAASKAGLPTPTIMGSNGGIANVETARSNAIRTVLSGPAAGVVGAAAAAGENGESIECDRNRDGDSDDIGDRDDNGDRDSDRDSDDNGDRDSDRDSDDNGDSNSDDNGNGVITFDMGGTSTDVSLVRDGSVDRTADTTIDGIPIRFPMVDIETVGAGGGSIAWTDAGGALRVGPESAGAEPGPACYGRGGTAATVTDAAVALGYIGPGAAFGGELSIDVDAAHEALGRLADEAGLSNATAAARGVYRVANATMTRAIRSISVERGHDPRRFGLIAFGGAGPMHAAALADTLGVSRVYVPGPAGVLSAYGLLAADEVHDAVQTVRLSLAGATGGRHGSEAETSAAATAAATYESLTAEVLAAVSDADADAVRIQRAADCRYAGQHFELTVPVGDVDGTEAARTADTDSQPFDPTVVAERFHTAHERTYGYRLDEAVEAVTLRVTATIDTESPTVRHVGGGDAIIGSRSATFLEAGTIETTVYDRDALAVGDTVRGPAILEQTESTTVVPPDWTGRVRDNGTLVLDRRSEPMTAAGRETGSGGDR